MESSDKISLDKLKAIPYFDPKAWTPSRHLPALFFFAKNEWHCWLAINGELQKMRMEPCQANYFGDRPERPTDNCFRFLHLTAQRASFAEMHRASSGIWNDFQDLATSLAKIKLFFETSKTKGLETTRFVQTEIEFIIMVCRSVFDLLQEMIAAHWSRIELYEKPKHKKKLPSSFGDVVLHGDTIRTSEQITEKYGLPKYFADWYVAQAPFFASLRRLRNEMAHGGNVAVKALYSTERGYAIHRWEKPWCSFYEWPTEVELPNQLVPIRPVLCSIISKVIAATDSFAQVLEGTIQLPNPLFPGFHFFSRGFYDLELSEISDVLEHSWWCDAVSDVTGPEAASSEAIRSGDKGSTPLGRPNEGD
jgi:hypothetical protein